MWERPVTTGRLHAPRRWAKSPVWATGALSGPPGRLVPVLFQDVVDTSGRVAATSSRTAKVDAVAAALSAAAAESTATLTAVASHLAGVLPQGRVGVSWRSLTELPSPASGPSLTVADVDAAATRLAGMAGTGVAARRRAELADLLGRATAAEQAFLRGLLTGELRQGAQDGVMLKAVATAFEVPESEVRRAVTLAGHTAEVAAVAAERGRAGLAAVRLEVGRPLRPMLAASASDVAAALGTIGTDRVVLDGKLDGIRVQAHKDGDEVRLFTRSLDDVTTRLPEVVEVVRALTPASLVLDGEVVALDRRGRPEPFQVTGARTASSTGPETLRAEVPVTPFFFDVLHLDGRDLTGAPAAERFGVLADVVPAAALVPRESVGDLDAAESFFAAQVEAGLEGVVAKSPDAPYAAGRRGSGWVKVKPRHTLDLVVLAVEWGSGRRRGWLSNIHLGARDADGFVMLGKTFKGMTDEVLAWQTERFLGLETRREGHVVHVRPEQVVEVAVDGVQRSTRYPGGVALRFARVLRYRDDKGPDEADTLETVRALDH